MMRTTISLAGLRCLSLRYAHRWWTSHSLPWGAWLGERSLPDPPPPRRGGGL